MSGRAQPSGAGARVSGHRARKRFGQHFLTDTRIIERLLDLIDPRPGQRLIEIGPGLGALTQGLIDRSQRLVAVELDRDLAKKLRARWAPAQLELIEADALRADWQTLTEPGASRLVGNLPYNISTPLLVRLIDCRAQVADQHFMLQKEVVNRIVADQGADYGRLGVLLQAFYNCTTVLDVPPDAFSPPPRVDSAVVRMRPLEQPRVPDQQDLTDLLAVAFGQRRKMLRRTLLPWLEARGVAGDELQPTARAEQVPADVYYTIAARLTAARCQ